MECVLVVLDVELSLCCTTSSPLHHLMMAAVRCGSGSVMEGGSAGASSLVLVMVHMSHFDQSGKYEDDTLHRVVYHLE